MPAHTSVTTADIRSRYTPEKQEIDYYLHPWGYYAIRPLSFPISAWCIRRAYSANNVTIFGLFILLAGTILIGASLGNVWLVVPGAVLVNFWYVSDFVDGNIARYLQSTSERGALLDTVFGHWYAVLVPVAVGCALFAIYGGEADGYQWLILGLVTALFHASRSSMSKSMQLKLSGGPTSGRRSRIAHAGYAIESLKPPSLLLCSLFGILDAWLVVYFLTALMSFAYTALRVIRVR